MINCPNCDKQIADDSAHCGYCGHQLEDKPKKKTMFGMAALGGDELKKAVEKAKEAKQNESEGDKDKKAGGLKIPKPGQGAKNEDGEKKGLKLPKPGQPKPEAIDEAGETDQSEIDQTGGDDEIGMAKTERIDLSDAKLPSDDDEPPTEPHTPATPQHQFKPEGSEGLGNESSATINVSNVSGDETLAGDDAPDQDPAPSFGEPSGPFGPGAKTAEEANQEHQPGVPDQNQPSPPAGGPPPEGPSPIAQQSDFGQQQVDASAPLEEQGSKKKMIIIGIVLATMVLGGGCVLGLAYWAYTSFF